MVWIKFNKTGKGQRQHIFLKERGEKGGLEIIDQSIPGKNT